MPAIDMTVQLGSHAIRTADRPKAAAPRVVAGNERQIDSADLLGNAVCIAIRHGGERYLLRATRQGKLLLTK